MSSSLNSSSSSDALAAFDWVMDVPCPVDVVLGSATLKVGECARLEVNSIVRLRQSAGSDLQLRVGGVPFGAGEVVITDGSVSLRLSRILPPAAGEFS